jgi:hypothetical protein
MKSLVDLRFGYGCGPKQSTGGGVGHVLINPRQVYLLIIIIIPSCDYNFF